jgi:outer membrane protein OmpA-like peptidoglycan-associated protein
MLPAHLRGSALPALLAATITGVYGCGHGASTSQPPPPVVCASAPTTATTPAVAVLAADSPIPPQVAAARAQALSTVVDGAKEMGADFLLNGVSNGIGAPNLLVNTTLVPQGQNRLFRTTNLACKTSAIAAGYRKLTMGTAPTAPDVVSALSVLKDDLKTIPHGQVNVVVLSSALDRTMLNVARPLDLSDHDTLANPRKAINNLARAGLNFDCTGWKVTMIGGSLDPQGRPLSATQDTQLQAFWKLYFQHCGGALVAYSTQIAQYPVASDPISGADRSVLELVRHARTVEATLSSEALFDTNSAELRPGAEGGLAQLLPVIAASKGPIDVAGFTDDTGSPAINVPLSERRAATVAAWLGAHARTGARRISARGLGSTEPVASNSTAGGRALNRRVTLTVFATGSDGGAGGSA